MYNFLMALLIPYVATISHIFPHVAFFTLNSTIIFRAIIFKGGPLLVEAGLIGKFIISTPQQAAEAMLKCCFSSHSVTLTLLTLILL